MDPEPEINSVQYLLKNNPVPFDQKYLIKKKGRPTDLYINYESTSKARTYNRVFNRNIYEKYGCSVTNKLLCFVCFICYSVDQIRT